MHATIEAAGVALAAYVHGDESAPAVLLIHGIASDALAWEEAVRGMAAAGTRAAVYDRRGYGASGAPQPFAATTVLEQSEDAVAVLDGLGMDRAIVAGDGFGALVALDVARRFPGRVTAVVASNPPLLELVADGSEVLSAQRLALEEDLREGGPRAAVAGWLGGRTSPEALARAQTAHESFFADFAGLPSWPASRREIRAMTTPVSVVMHPMAPPHICAAATSLAELLPAATIDPSGDLVAAVRARLA